MIPILGKTNPVYTNYTNERASELYQPNDRCEEMIHSFTISRRVYSHSNDGFDFFFPASKIYNFHWQYWGSNQAVFTQVYCSEVDIPINNVQSEHCSLVTCLLRAIDLYRRSNCNNWRVIWKIIFRYNLYEWLRNNFQYKRTTVTTGKKLFVICNHESRRSLG
jgi:hypothetical protein